MLLSGQIKRALPFLAGSHTTCSGCLGNTAAGDPHLSLFKQCGIPNIGKVVGIRSQMMPPCYPMGFQDKHQLGGFKDKQDGGRLV